MIDVININDINSTQFYEKYILLNKPCIIKNFLSENNKCYKFFSDTKNLNLFYIGYAKAYNIKTKCYTDFIE